MSSSLPLIALILSVISLLGVMYILWNVRSLNKLKTSFFAGQNGADLESIIQNLDKQLRDLQQEHLVLEHALTMLQNKLSFAVQKTGLVRFNPFDDGGGNFSFCLALLDSHNTGVVITSMHGRQQNRIYTKKIQDGRSETALTEEEQQAINLANQKTNATQEH
jgi:hypothetical protein